jgi:hypothetical protein
MEPQCDLRRLQLGTPSRRVRCQEASHRDEDVFGFKLSLPFRILADAGLNHLQGVEIGILAHRGMHERVKKRTYGMAQTHIPGDNAGRTIDLLAPIQQLEESAQERCGVARLGIERFLTR